MAPRTSPVDYTDVFTAHLTALARANRTVTEGFNALVDRVAAVPAPGGTAWWLHERLTELRDAVAALRERAARLQRHQLPVLSLMAAAVTWYDRIAEGATGVVTTVADGMADPGLAGWSGGARGYYDTAAGAQLGAARLAGSDASAVGGYLEAFARANVDYAAELLAALARLAAELVGAAVDEVAATDLPPLVDRLARAAGAAHARLTRSEGGIARRIADNLAHLTSPAGGHDPVREGHWPVSVGVAR